MATTINSLQIKSIEDHRDDFLRSYRNALIQRGIANPDVSDGSLIFVKATAFAQQLYAASTNVPLVADAQMPDSAQGDDLVRYAARYKLSLRPAGPSTGPALVSTSLAPTDKVAIATGSQLIDTVAGNLYTVTAGGLFANKDPIQIKSAAVGSATNLKAGVTLRWLAPPSYVNTTAAVGPGGLTGGVDAETYEGLRVRVLDHEANPPNGSNWASIAKAGNESSTAVQATFVYPAYNGPSTEAAVCTRAPTATNKGRQLDAVVINTMAAPAIFGAFPEFVDTLVQTVADYPVDVSFGLDLPSATSASPPGIGGGWVDATPFPQDATNHFCPVSATSGTEISVDSDTAPIAGGSVSWISRADWTLYTATIASFTGTGPSYSLVLSNPLADSTGATITTDDWIFPASVNGAVYLAAVLAMFAGLGPGEKTDNVTLISRAIRRPLAASSWPSSLNRRAIRTLIDSAPEVDDAAFLYANPGFSPPIPTLITDPPNCIVPRLIGFYPTTEG